MTCSTLNISLQSALNTTLSKPVPETDGYGAEQSQAKQRRSPTIVICDRSPLLDLVYSPQVQACTIAQRKTSDDGERPSSCKSQAITKVEQRSGDGTDEDGEF